MKIQHRITGETIFDSPHETMWETIEAANLEWANLEGANLEGANLEGANLEWANLKGANLKGANLEGANLEGANLKWANLEGANLEGANLEWANLEWANLKGANLEWANLEWANLKGANLEGANLEGANLPILDTIQKMPMRSLICAEVCAAPEKLEMATWHTCDTVHCIAGWAIVLHPKGKELESRIGTSAAAALILWKCESEIPDFNSSNEEAMEWLRKGQ